MEKELKNINETFAKSIDLTADTLCSLHLEGHFKKLHFEPRTFINAMLIFALIGKSIGSERGIITDENLMEKLSNLRKLSIDWVGEDVVKILW